MFFPMAVINAPTWRCFVSVWSPLLRSWDKLLRLVLPQLSLFLQVISRMPRILKICHK